MFKHQPANSRKNYNYNAFIYTDTRYQSHFHANYELIFVMEGRPQVSLGGLDYPLEAGDCLLVSPYVVHGFTVRDARIWVGVFSDEYVSAFADTHAQTQFSRFRCDEKLTATLTEQLFFEGQPDHYHCMALLYSVCNACLKNATPLQIRADANLIRSIIDYVSQNLETDLTLGDLAGSLGYEYHYFSALFHQCFGVHFKKFLNLYRVEKACWSLEKSDADVTEVCRSCGFSGLRNFNRVFKQNTGLTPTEYRREHRDPRLLTPLKGTKR